MKLINSISIYYILNQRALDKSGELIKNFGIDASRLESDGLGETKPVAPNDNQANKAMNRRVEFIKL